MEVSVNTKRDLFLLTLLLGITLAKASTLSLQVGVAEKIPGWRSEYEQSTNPAIRLQMYSTRESKVQRYFSFSYILTPVKDRDIQHNDSTSVATGGDAFTFLGIVGARFQSVSRDRLNYGIYAGVGWYYIGAQECKSEDSDYSYESSVYALFAAELGAEIGYSLSENFDLTINYTMQGYAVPFGESTRNLFVFGLRWVW